MKKNKKNEIIQLILADHKPLKECIKILKETENPIFERQATFEEFVPLLLSHAQAEEEALYKNVEQNEDLRTEGFEGEVEHSLAEQMVASVQAEQNEDMWTAKAKVLAELVEHHIQEEEEEMLPDVRQIFPIEMREEMGEIYVNFKNKREEGQAEIDQAEESSTEQISEQPQVQH